MSKIQLIYFKDCPNARAAKALLEDANLKFDIIIQDELPKTHPLRNYSSPTILLGEEVIAGTRLKGPLGSCSIFSLTKAELLARIKR